ncbi:hypothetical protein [Bifidobacterium xylocopae]|uniref:hypothetical protein n=1 Tax=Bifidobacterium xylocopae TaxID=2493119 RepID=UPI0011AB47A5|nr:hypothetical protein [Bifidobacterium xylocopae]
MRTTAAGRGARRYLGSADHTTSRIIELRNLFWPDFYDYYATRPDFVSAFRDLSSRSRSNGSSATFSGGIPNTNQDTLLGQRNNYIAIVLYCQSNELYS